MDRGYRSYEGPRTGLSGAIRSVVRYSVRHTLGLGRAARHKVLPTIAIALAIIPAVVYVGLAVIIDVDLITEQILPDYHEYYGFITTSLWLFCGIVVPDILVADRRNGMLPLYLSTPLRRSTYLLSKALAVMVTLAIITVGPVLFLLVAYTLEGSGPDGLIEWIKILLRILASGAAISAAFTAASLAAASLTERRAFAAIGVVLLLIVSSATVNIVVQEADVDARLHALDLGGISNELKNRIFAVEPEEPEGFEFGSSQGTVSVESAPLAPIDAPPVGEVSDFDSGPSPTYVEDPMMGDADMMFEDDMYEPPEPMEPEPVRSEFAGAVEGIDSLSTWFVVLANLAWVTLGCSVVWLRYRRLALAR